MDRLLGRSGTPDKAKSTKIGKGVKTAGVHGIEREQVDGGKVEPSKATGGVPIPSTVPPVHQALPPNIASPAKPDSAILPVNMLESRHTFGAGQRPETCSRTSSGASHHVTLGSLADDEMSSLDSREDGRLNGARREEETSTKLTNPWPEPAAAI